MLWLLSKALSPLTASVAPLFLPLNLDGTITYVPNNGFTGTDTLTYEVSDGQGGTDQATVTITVGAPGNSVPVAVFDLESTPYETPVTVDVLSNDYDDDGDPLSVQPTLISGPSDGVAVVQNGKECSADWIACGCAQRVPLLTSVAALSLTPSSSPSCSLHPS